VIQVFEGHEVRIVVRGGKPWFVAVDVARVLGYERPDQAIRDHCKGAEAYPLASRGQVRHLKIIPERDVYRLVMRSRLPSAERFEEWVVGEVLPTLRDRELPNVTNINGNPMVVPQLRITQRGVARAIERINERATA
jgi:prophage antirepressor-like protein